MDLIYYGYCRIQNSSQEQEVRELLSRVGIRLNLIREDLDMIDSTGDTGVNEDDSTDDSIVFEDDSTLDTAMMQDESTASRRTLETVFQPCSDEGDDSFQDCFQHSVFEENFSHSPIRFEVTDFEVKEVCSKFCYSKCKEVFELWSSDMTEQLKTMFLSDKGIVETKNNLIKHLVSQSNIGVTSDQYIVNNHLFCNKFFASVTNISEHLVKSVLRDFWMGQRVYKHGNAGNVKQKTVATTNFICWLKQFAESYGQFAPDTNTTVLSYWLYKQVLFKLYKDETTEPHLSQAAFYQNYKAYFGFNRCDKSLPHVIISKYSSHSICTICVALNNNRRQCKTDQEMKQATDLRNQHKLTFGEARRTIQEIKQSALSFPSDHLFLQIDGMDNKKSYIPRLLQKSKDMMGTERLASKISGCILYSGWYEKKRKCLFYINHDQVNLQYFLSYLN